MFSIIIKYDRLWDIECGACLRVLEGHEELVRCIRFDNKRIVSGAYDGSVMHTHTHLFVLSDIWHVVLHTIVSCTVYSKIKVWDLQAALDPRAPASTLCLRTLVVRDAAIFIVFNFWLTGSQTQSSLRCLVGQNLGYLRSSSMIHLFFFFFSTGAFWKSVPSSVWWVSDHQQFSWRHHSDLGFPERLHQRPARGAVSLPHLHVYF